MLPVLLLHWLQLLRAGAPALARKRSFLSEAVEGRPRGAFTTRVRNHRLGRADDALYWTPGPGLSCIGTLRLPSSRAKADPFCVQDPARFLVTGLRRGGDRPARRRTLGGLPALIPPTGTALGTPSASQYHRTDVCEAFRYHDVQRRALRLVHPYLLAVAIPDQPLPVVAQSHSLRSTPPRRGDQGGEG